MVKLARIIYEDAKNRLALLISLLFFLSAFDLSSSTLLPCVVCFRIPTAELSDAYEGLMGLHIERMVLENFSNGRSGALFSFLFRFHRWLSFLLFECSILVPCFSWHGMAWHGV